MIAIIVMFVMTMFLWLLSMLGVFPANTYSPWLAFFACLFLGAAVFRDQWK